MYIVLILWYIKYSPNQNNVPDPADPSLRDRKEIEQLIKKIENSTVLGTCVIGLYIFFVYIDAIS